MKEAVVASLSDEFSPHETCDRSGLLLLDALLCPGVLLPHGCQSGKMSLMHSLWYVTAEAHSISTLLFHLTRFY